MNDLYSWLVSSLDCDDAHSIVAQLTAQLGEQPITLRDSGDLGHDHTFQHSGIGLDCVHNRITMIVFAIRAAARAGRLDDDKVFYNGNLPSGIVSSDRRHDVSRKVKIKPIERVYEFGGEIMDEYSVGSLRLIFVFDQRSSQLLRLAVVPKSDKIVQ
jgi:hypothetical protein